MRPEGSTKTLKFQWLSLISEKLGGDDDGCLAAGESGGEGRIAADQPERRQYIDHID
jgi:hypothetical protein